MDSGLWHHTHLSGHPFTKNVVRTPGPSWMAKRLVSSMSGTFVRPSRATNRPGSIAAAPNPMNSLRFIRTSNLVFAVWNYTKSPFA